jgi:oxalate decarboxylase/phosphoglucose isomerase-like protein (cupin superfamily)
VIEGELAFRIGDHAMTAGPGTLAFVPRGTPHTFANPTIEPVRTLVWFTPAGFERYFEALIEAAARTGGIPSEAELTELGIAHGSIPVST